MRKLLLTIATVLAVAPLPVVAEQQSRSLNVTRDSAPGWLPSEEQEAAAVEAALNYFTASDAGATASSYALLTPEMKRTMPEAQHGAAAHAFNSEAGALVSRDIIRTTWTKDPANAPRPGVYAAIDLATRYVNIDRHCGYIIMYQAAEGEPFMVMRTQSTMLANVAADALRASGQDVDQVWMGLSRATCPNYSPAPDGSR